MVGEEDAHDDQSQLSQTGGKLKQYINKKNEEAGDAMSNIATAHVSCKRWSVKHNRYYFRG